MDLDESLQKTIDQIDKEYNLKIEEETIISVSNSYISKYYLDKRLDILPKELKDGIKIMMVSFTEENGGILEMRYNDKLTSIFLFSYKDDNDYLYDDFDDLHINGYYDDDNDFDEYDDLNFEAKKGLSKIILNNMEISKMKNVEKLDTDKKKCTICLENYKNGDDSIALPCIHIFHAECIKTWLKNNTTCPICKNEIKYDEYEEVGGGGSLDDEFY